MATHDETPQAEDLASVGSRISWGAILAGSFLALAMHVLLTVLGAAVGLQMSDRVQSDTLVNTALIWAVIVVAASFFVGGLVTSLFAVGENKVEACVYGVIMWAFVTGVLILMASSGVRAGYNGLMDVATAAQGTSDWQQAAKDAGVDPQQLEQWRKQAATDLANKAQDPQTRDQIQQGAKRTAWYVFGGVWLSMLFAALGAYMGAGPTFRLARVHPRPVM
ncbi:MAG: hypothetical protein U0744_00070 [Gemmataceae bacterium]